MFAKILIAWCSVFAVAVYAMTTYDQSQTGELNVQVDLKDVQIIALMKSGKEEYVDYDYAYDYSEMTIKPQNGTTPKPLNASSVSEDLSTENSTAGLTILADTFAETTTEPNKNISNINKNATIVVDQSVLNETTTVKNIELTTKTEELTEVNGASLSLLPSNSTNTTCKKGFIQNQKGGCELKIQSASNALLKIIKLSQKLKRRENRKDIETVTASKQ